MGERWRTWRLRWLQERVANAEYYKTGENLPSALARYVGRWGEDHTCSCAYSDADCPDHPEVSR